jgi:hypothetical protein
MIKYIAKICVCEQIFNDREVCDRYYLCFQIGERKG